jgi:predicted TIM-barrel fold metal-dependent hydrolase
MSAHVRDRLLEEMSLIQTVDCHSHTKLQREYYALEQRDLFTIVSYFAREMQALYGTSDKTPEVLYARARNDEEKWEILRYAIYQAGNTSYWRHNMVMYRKLFGLRDAELTDHNWSSVNETIKATTADPDWYRRVTKEYCNLVTQIRNVPWYEDWEPEYFTCVLRMEPALQLLDSQVRRKLEEHLNRSFDNLPALKNGLADFVASYNARGNRGLKLAHAYSRTLASEEVPASVANRILFKALQGGAITPREQKQVQDHLIFYMGEMAQEMGLVFQIHTGVQGNYGWVPDSNPLHLLPLIKKYPKVKFDLFHAGYPYIREIGMLAKHWPNVYLNMAWMYVISMEASRQGLSEWIDLVPGSRLLAFGSDVGWPEMIYSHLIMARSCLADVFAAKIERDFFSEKMALELLRRMLNDTPMELYKLGSA